MLLPVRCWLPYTDPSFAAHWWAIATVERLQRDPKHPFFRGGWDNQNPRAWVARLNAHVAAGKRLSPLEQRVLRAQSAQQNGFGERQW